MKICTNENGIDKFKIYIINQESRTDRKNTMEQQFKHFNITNYEFFKAYDKNNKDVLNDYNKFKKYSSYSNKIGVVGIIYSTINLFKHINETLQDDFVIIMEDDALLHNNFKNLFKFDVNNKNVDIALLGYILLNNKGILNNEFKNHNNELLCINKYIEQNIKFLGRHAYICNKKYRKIIIDKGIQWFLNNNFHMDYGYKELNNELNYYIFGGEQLAIQNIFDKNSVNFNNIGSNHWYKRLLINDENYYNLKNQIQPNICKPELKPKNLNTKINFLKFINKKYKTQNLNNIKLATDKTQNLNNIKLSIVLLCFNKLNYTLDCIDSIIKNTSTSYELVIVNNSSTDGTRDYIDNLNMDNLIVIHNSENYGFSKGMNIGIRKASGKYIILLNNDTVVSKNWDYPLIDILENNENVFAVTPMTNYCGNEARVDIKHDSISDFFEKMSNLGKDLVPCFETKSLNLYCGVFRQKDLIDIGFIDEQFFNGWEDDDLYERIAEINKQVMISTQSIVYHHGSITVGKKNYTNINGIKNKLKFEIKWSKKWKRNYKNELMIKNGVVNDKIKNKLWCHLHCFNIDKFDEIYGDIITIIQQYFSTVVTYCEGSIIPEKYNMHYIKIQNKGMDIGAKFKFIEFLKNNKINYDYVLMLHSKSNVKQRERYFKPFYNLKNIMSQLDGINGAITIDIVAQPNKSPIYNKFVNINNIDYVNNWDRNSIHMEHLIKLMDLPFYNCLFVEGNVYILHKEIADYLYDNRFGLYDKLNDTTTFDYSWFVNYYNKHTISYDDAYASYNKNNLYGNNLQVIHGDKQLRACMIEHCFERLVFGVCVKLNKKVHILGYDVKQNGIINNTIVLKDNILKDVICIFHCGSIDIFNEILRDFPIIYKYKLIITFYNYDYYKLIDPKLNVIKMIKVENKGADCGPMLLSLKFLLENTHLYDENTIFLKIHTKTLKEWRNQLLIDILNVDYNKIPKTQPIIFGSNKYIFIDNKGINKIYIKDIVSRNDSNNNEKFELFYDKYYDAFIDNNNVSTNKFTDLIPSLNFYKSYEPDLKHLTNLDHWYVHGVNEFHRKSNVNYIDTYSKYENLFIAGTMFGFNTEYLLLFKKYNLDFEYSLLEDNYIKNYIPTKTHSWEYYFGLITFLNNGKILGVNNNTIVEHKLKNINSDKIKYSIINVPFKKSKIAIFMLFPGNIPDSGGYRTLLNYINFLNNNGYSLDIYFGISWNDNETYNSVHDLNKDGMPSNKHIGNSNININIHTIVKNINNYNVLDITKNNYFIGFRCQKKYDILIANAWQIASPVYENKDYAKHIYYIIQDREELFYDDNNLKKNVLNTYKSEYKYYFITNYLSKYFTQNYSIEHYCKSTLSVNLKMYYNLNSHRTDSVVIPYYQNIKPGRMPQLVEKIINILSENNILCIIYPFNYTKITNKYIINIGNQDETSLNNLYNEHKVGIVFSNTNPSRLGFEMYASGMQVIEYDSEFTKYDMPDKYFTKIKNEENILSIVNELFNKPYDDGLLNEIDINNDYNKFLKFIEMSL